MNVRALLVLIAVSASARAEAPRRLDLSYEAGALCASEEALVAEVQKRVPHSARVRGGPSDVSARVRFERGDGQLRASVTLTSLDGSAEREVRGADCDEVTRALALIVALALDPDASADAPAAPPPAEPARPAPPPPPLAARPRPADSAVWLGAGATVGLTGGVAPALTPYAGLFVEAGLRGSSPSLRLSALRARATTQTDAGSAELDWLALRSSACPVGLGSRLFARACVTFDAGRLRGRGYATLEPRSESSTWYGPGVALGLGARLFGPLSLGADLGVVAPLTRDRFYFGPDVTAHRIPALAGYFGLGLGLGI